MSDLPSHVTVIMCVMSRCAAWNAVLRVDLAQLEAEVADLHAERAHLAREKKAAEEEYLERVITVSMCDVTFWAVATASSSMSNTPGLRICRE